MENINDINDKTPYSLWLLFKTCFMISACTFGGGMVIISMLQKKFVEEFKWFTQEEIMDMVAIAQSSPGVMAVNTSIIIGYRMGGFLGALLTMLGTVTPPMVILSVISLFYKSFRDNIVISLILRGMQAGVAAVMISVTITMAGAVLKAKEFVPNLLLIGASIAATWFGVDILIVLLVCGMLGGIYTIFTDKRKGGVS